MCKKIIDSIAQRSCRVEKKTSNNFHYQRALTKTIFWVIFVGIAKNKTYKSWPVRFLQVFKSISILVTGSNRRQELMRINVLAERANSVL